MLVSILRRARNIPGAADGGRKVTLLPATLVVAALASLVGCQSTPPVGPVPSPSTPVSASPSPISSPSPSAAKARTFKLEININAHTVSPLRRSVRLQRGQPVDLVIHSDHDGTVTIDGPKLHKKVVVHRLVQIPVTFVANRPGVITIASSDPKATVARLTVS